MQQKAETACISVIELLPTCLVYLRDLCENKVFPTQAWVIGCNAAKQTCFSFLMHTNLNQPVSVPAPATKCDLTWQQEGRSNGEFMVLFQCNNLNAEETMQFPFIGKTAVTVTTNIHWKKHTLFILKFKLVNTVERVFIKSHTVYSCVPKNILTFKICNPDCSKNNPLKTISKSINKRVGKNMWLMMAGLVLGWLKIN